MKRSMATGYAGADNPVSQSVSVTCQGMLLHHLPPGLCAWAVTTLHMHALTEPYMCHAA
jgi:hypothetical protein